MLRRLRNRIGIRAPRLAVRTHLPWHWRALSIVVLTACSLALAGWIYDAGRRFAGFDRSETDQAIELLKDRVSSLESELAQARSIANTSDSSLRIERTTQQLLSNQVKALGTENIRLREDLAVFENMAKNGLNDGSVGISRLSVEPGGTPETFQYRLLIAQQAGKKDKDFKGTYQLILNIQQQGNNVMINLPKAGAADAGHYQISFRHFRRIEGSFSIPAGSRLLAVEAKLIQEGVVKASQRVQL